MAIPSPISVVLIAPGHGVYDTVHACIVIIIYVIIMCVCEC